MDNLYINILGFAACAGIIIYSGTKLSFYGDKIADLTGMGKAWIGLILMASVTSLPELITGISSVAIVKEPDLAAGDIFGSCVFNLLLLSLLDARIKQPLFSQVKSSHIVAAIFGIILLTVAGMAIYLADETPSLLWISSFTFVLFAI
jgi:cation:H+ antiporter